MRVDAATSQGRPTAFSTEDQRVRHPISRASLQLVAFAKATDSGCKSY